MRGFLQNHAFRPSVYSDIQEASWMPFFVLLTLAADRLQVP
jgi:hypothetical protein